MPTDYFIGLMSGTSMDAIDAALVAFHNDKPKLIEALNFPITDSLRNELQALCQPGENEIERLGRADTQLGILFAGSVKHLLKQAHMKIKTEDKIVQAVLRKMDERSLTGQKKYGATMMQEIEGQKISPLKSPLNSST